MMSVAEFCDELKRGGIDFVTGVPCSFLSDVIDALDKDSDMHYVPAVREDTAVGLAAGVYLAGRRPMVLMPNSGLGICINALASLILLYKIPLLMLISWRGYEGKDAPEHLIMGRAMPDLLDSIGLSYHVLGPGNARAVLDAAFAGLSTGMPVAIVLRKGALVWSGGKQ